MREPRRVSRIFASRIRIAGCAGMLAMALSGCGAVMTGLVGADPNAKAPAKPAEPPPPVTTSFAGQTILPPTLPAAANETAVVAAEPAAATPHRALASAPLAADAAALAKLGDAAKLAASGPDARFVLLVLTPPAADATTMDKTNSSARLAAQLAVKALGDAGISQDRVEVSMATSADAGSGEMRLYRR